MTCPRTSLRSGLFIQTAIHWVDWKLLKPSCFHLHSSWMKTLFSFIAFLVGRFSSVPQTWRRLKFLWDFLPFLRQEYRFPPQSWTRAVFYKHPGISLQPNPYPCKEEGKPNKSHESNSSFKSISCSICSTLRFVSRFKRSLCLSPPACSTFWRIWAMSTLWLAIYLTI